MIVTFVALFPVTDAHKLAAMECSLSDAVLPPPQPDTDPALHDVMSSHEYTWACQGDDGQWRSPQQGPKNVFVPIEPLAGPLRHPKFCESDDYANLVRRDYIAWDRWATHFVSGPARCATDAALLTRPRTALYFDVGASTWKDGEGGPSQPYFVSWIQKNCLEVRGILAWEGVKADPAKVWALIPGEDVDPCVF